MNSAECAVLKCLDPEVIIPISRQSTTHFKTGTWSRLRPRFMEKISPCREACPIGNDIPRALHAAAEGDYDRALSVFLQESPLPGVCGRVCYHPCQIPCNRVELDGAVHIQAIERAASELGSAEPALLTDRGKDRPVAVIGSGPAGLSAAYHLARMGHPVTLLESEERPGGLLARGIPAFRLPEKVVKRDLERIFSLSIRLETRSRVDGPDLQHLLKDYEAVFVASGASVHQRLGLEGEEWNGVFPGLEFLGRIDLQHKAQGADVIVIGGGNTAMDAARTALRRGAKKVTIIYRRTRSEMPAFADEVTEAEEEGIAMKFLSGPLAFFGDKDGVKALRMVEMGLGPAGEDGRPRPIPVSGSETELHCDMVIIATGQGLEKTGLIQDLRLEKGRVWVDHMGRTSRERLFAGGDITPTRASVVDAMASGKGAAVAIHLTLTERDHRDVLSGVGLGQGPAFSIEALFHRPANRDPRHVVFLDELDRLTSPPMPPAHLPHRSVSDRIRTFDETALSLNSGQAQKEAQRCFFCGSCVGCDRCYIFCPEGAVIPPEKAGDAYRAHDDYCKGCGTCASVCVRGILVNKEQ